MNMNDIITKCISEEMSMSVSVARSNVNNTMLLNGYYLQREAQLSSNADKRHQRKRRKRCGIIRIILTSRPTGPR